MSIAFKPAEECPHYDLVLATCGYEARSAGVLRLARPGGTTKIAFGYTSHEQLSYESNRAKFLSHGYTVESVSDDSFATEVGKLVRRVDSTQSPRLFIDMSCLTRARLAALIEVLAQARRTDVDFWYSLASYSAPTGADSVHQFVEPVSGFFAGWSGSTDKPPAVIAGLGYEHMRAIGVLEHLDAADAWLFFPRSPLAKYDIAVRSANELLLEQADVSRVIEYEVSDLYGLCQSLFSLAGSVRLTHRCSLVPLGPKPFALACLLAGVAYRDVSVWRVSAGEFAQPVDKRSSRLAYSLRVEFVPE